MPLPPFVPAQRGNVSAIPGIELLQQLLGREAQPEFPEIPQVGMEELLDEMQQAALAGDTERFHAIRGMVDQRQPRVQPRAPRTTPKKSRKKEVSYNPFNTLVEAMRESTR